MGSPFLVNGTPPAQPAGILALARVVRFQAQSEGPVAGAQMSSSGNSLPRYASIQTTAMEAESSVELLQRVRQGDRDALDQLLRRYVPALRRWARGRLPRWARDLADTDDLVQETVVRTLRRLNDFEWRDNGGLQTYLRQAVLNRIRDECRRVGRRPAVGGLDEHLEDQGVSPLEAAIGAEALERYERALKQLRPEDQEAIVARIEMGYAYGEIAVMLGKPTSDAARVAVSRALVRLAEVLCHAR